MNPSGRERRLSPRFVVRVACAITLPLEEQSILFPRARLDAYTRDLSESGLGVVVSSIYIGYDCVVDEGRALRLALELPGGTVGLEATAAHYLRLDRGGEEISYLIGMRITEMSGEAHARYAAYLGELAEQEMT
ncbi:MAG: PilZ domain-containing protein [Pyrinomonadaceae bacterium]